MLRSHFHTSAQAINLTITVYIIFQAISPVLLASVSDHFGRRPIYLMAFTLFTFSSLGLALNESSYAVLLLLRALQSLGASAVLSLSYGTLADITVSAERGKMLGPMLAATIPSTFKAEPYAFSELEVGLAYLPGSLGVIVSMYVTGKALDNNYDRAAREMGFTVDKVKGDDLTNFPIERARSRWCAYLLLLSLAAIAGTLLVDTIEVAIIQPLIDVMGKGWLFTLLGILTGAGGFAAHHTLRQRGMEWRNSRKGEGQTGIGESHAEEGRHDNESPIGLSSIAIFHSSSYDSYLVLLDERDIPVAKYSQHQTAGCTKPVYRKEKMAIKKIDFEVVWISRTNPAVAMEKYKSVTKIADQALNLVG
ncbi:putative major facilitator superfamily [Phaeomoniella chlamydospora]|uniref:Putative major facilitator superfamily n=1 Tax=Phaeomoniella chlamydospora TaxID=158046 RepID=A0A0G2EZ55_PHACM|nr:putative major facilitator superfamily [Phaeomoniella chlamydospora]